MRYAAGDHSARDAPRIDGSSSSCSAASETVQSCASPAEALRHQQRLRRQRRVEILRRKRSGLVRSSGSPTQLPCSSLSCWSGSTDFTAASAPFAAAAVETVDVAAAAVGEVEIPAHLSAKEIRKLKNRLSAERSRNRKLGLLDALATQARDLAQRHDQLLRDNAQLQQLLAAPPASWLPLHCCAAAVAAGIPREVVVTSAADAVDDASSCSSLSTPPSPSLVSAAPPEPPVTFDALPASDAAAVYAPYVPCADVFQPLSHIDSFTTISSSSYELDGDASFDLLEGDFSDVPDVLLMDSDVQELLRYSPEPVEVQSGDWDSIEYSALLDSFEMLL